MKRFLSPPFFATLTLMALLPQTKMCATSLAASMSAQTKADTLLWQVRAIEGQSRHEDKLKTYTFIVGGATLLAAGSIMLAMNSRQGVRNGGYIGRGLGGEFMLNGVLSGLFMRTPMEHVLRNEFAKGNHLQGRQRLDHYETAPRKFAEEERKGRQLLGGVGIDFGTAITDLGAVSIDQDGGPTLVALGAPAAKLSALSLFVKGQFESKWDRYRNTDCW